MQQFYQFVLVINRQIDHILINKHGVFVIETKNYAGRIYGKENQTEWTQVLSFGKVKNHFYSPVKQNATHVYRIASFLPEGTPIKSVVVFARGNIEYIEAKEVYDLSGLKKAINQPITKNSLSLEEMKKCYEAILDAKKSCNVSATQHVKEIHHMKENIQNNICPRCSGKLVLKHGKSGDFYGCSNYPKCKFTKKIDK